MTYVEPTPPGAPQPEIQPPDTPGPDLDPSAVPDEVPPLQPGGGGEGDSRPHDGAPRFAPKSPDSLAFV